MLRHEWEFEYTASVLAEAATMQREFRKGRVEWWTTKQAEVMSKIRESGISVHESPGASYSNTTAGYGPQVMIDSTLQQDLTECATKIKEHTAQMKAYDGWVQVLSANPDSRVKLHHDDWLVFFGK
jgi:hypothetical protein